MYEASKLSAHVEIGDEIQDSYVGISKEIEAYNKNISELETENDRLRSR
jgi:uncharacterized protein Yka (UPF0111/DUF47 family)